MSIQGIYGRAALAVAAGMAALTIGSAQAAEPAAAAAAAPRPAPAPRPPPVKDYKAAPAGKYTIDANHTGLVARVPHQGLSYSIFRFGAVTGTLTWDPANPAANTLNVSVDPTSIATPVKGFPEELAGDRFLKAAQFLQATFVSKSFKPIDASHGKVDGDFTLLGVTKPLSFDVELIGAGKGFRGDVIGAAARGKIDPKDYGLAAIPGPIELNIDLELDRQP